MLNLNLKHMRFVDAAARHGSIAQAAIEMHISQSSVTAAIDAVEAQLGFDLFTRTPAKGIRPTSAGREALSLIKGFLGQARHVSAELESIGGDMVGTLRIGCYVSTAPSFLPVVLKSFSQGHPGVSIKVLEGDMAMVLEFLDEGEVDLVFTYNVFTYNKELSPRHRFEDLFHAPPYALLPADHALARQACVAMAELAPLPMVMLDLAWTQDYYRDMFASCGLAPIVAHSTRSVEITRSLVSAGLGYTILNFMPPDYRGNDPRFRAIPISDPLDRPCFGIATQQVVNTPRMIGIFIQHCRDLQAMGAFDKSVI